MRYVAPALQQEANVIRGAMLIAQQHTVVVPVSYEKGRTFAGMPEDDGEVLGMALPLFGCAIFSPMRNER